MKRKLIFGLLGKHIKKTWIIWIASIIFPAVFTNISRLLIAQLTQDSMYRTRDADSIMSTAWIILFLLAGAVVAEIIASFFKYLQYAYGINTENKLRENMYQNLLHRKHGHSKLDIGEITTRYNKDVKAAVSMICADLERLIFPIIVGVTFCVAIFLKNYIIGIGIMFILCLVTSLSIVFINKFNKLEKAILEKMDIYSKQISSAYGGKMTIRMMNLQEYVDKSNEKVVMELDRLNKRKVRLTFIKALTTDNLTALCASLMLPFACVFVSSGLLDLPEALYIASLSGSIIGFTSTFSTALIDLKKDYVSAVRIEQQLSVPNDRYVIAELNNEESGPDENSDTVLEFQNFSVDYDGIMVLNNVNLSVKKGEIVALVGKSGSGKSTLIKSVLGFNDYKGLVLLNDRKVTNMTVSEIRKKIAYVPEESNVFNASVYENIRYGNLEADDCEIMEAMCQAGLKEYIEDDKIINFESGENGDNLSGGLRQRIALARAFLKDADILFMDEPTAALDALTEHQIMEHLRSLAKSGKTILVVSHRASTISYADRVLLVKDNEVREEQDFKDISVLLGECKTEADCD
ncbi:MAG: ABC transporter ATP-binding protein [Clostridiales bacterium]|nr:ABC transporter ATP-binding protein [Clostridiales bacterium]